MNPNARLNGRLFIKCDKAPHIDMPSFKPLFHTQLYNTFEINEKSTPITSNTLQTQTNNTQSSEMAASTCCKKSGETCVWYALGISPLPELVTNFCSATQAKCSCGEKSALACTCGQSETENKVSGARCSCRMSITSTTNIHSLHIINHY